MLGDEFLELGDELRMTTEGDVGIDPILERREPQLLEALAGCRSERLVGEIGEWRPSPEVERLAEERGRRARVVTRPRTLGLGRQVLEAREVEVIVADPECVSGRPRLDRSRRTERPPELGDLPLHLRDRGDGRATGVQIVREALDRDDAVRVQQQDRERRALTRPAEPDRAAVADDLQRTQHAELEHSLADGSRSVAGR